MTMKIIELPFRVARFGAVKDGQQIRLEEFQRVAVTAAAKIEGAVGKIPRVEIVGTRGERVENTRLEIEGGRVIKSHSFWIGLDLGDGFQLSSAGTTKMGDYLHIRAVREFPKGIIEYDFSSFRERRGEYRETSVSRDREILFKVESKGVEVPIKLHYCSAATNARIGASRWIGETSFDYQREQMLQDGFGATVIKYRSCRRDGHNMAIIIEAEIADPNRFREEALGKIEPPEERCDFFRRIEK